MFNALIKFKSSLELDDIRALANALCSLCFAYATVRCMPCSLLSANKRLPSFPCSISYSRFEMQFSTSLNYYCHHFSCLMFFCFLSLYSLSGLVPVSILFNFEEKPLLYFTLQSVWSNIPVLDVYLAQEASRLNKATAAIEQVTDQVRLDWKSREKKWRWMIQFLM